MVSLHPTGLFFPRPSQTQYALRAKGFQVAALAWGDCQKPLSGREAFAYVPIDQTGNASFRLPGAREIPKGATHVWATCYRADFGSFEEVSLPLPWKPLLGENTFEKKKPDTAKAVPGFL